MINRCGLNMAGVEDKTFEGKGNYFFEPLRQGVHREALSIVFVQL
jgi:hypothetical protein